MKVYLIMNALALLCLVTPSVTAQIGGRNQNNIPSVGTVQCTLLPERKNNKRVITEATLSPTSNGFDLNFSDTIGSYLLRLNYKLIISEALTLGDEPASWNLIGYVANPTPVIIRPNGDFSISMMVSTRSSCTFKGQLTFAPGAREKLFGL